MATNNVHVQTWVDQCDCVPTNYQAALPTIDLCDAHPYLNSQFLNDESCSSTASVYDVSNHLQMSPSLPRSSPILFSDSGIASDRDSDAGTVERYMFDQLVALSEVENKFLSPPLNTYYPIEAVNSAHTVSRKQKQPPTNKISAHAEAPSTSEVSSRCPLSMSNCGNITEVLNNKPEWADFFQALLQQSFQSSVLPDGREDLGTNESFSLGAAFTQNENHPKLYQESCDLLDYSLEEILSANLDKKAEDVKSTCQRKRTRKYSGRRNYFVKQMRSANDTYFYSFSTTSVPPGLCASAVINRNGGSLVLADISAGLFFDADCIKGDSINASLSACLDDDFPPIQSNQIMMSLVMRCGPSGETFDKPAILEVPHSANLDEDEERKIQVWCKSKARDPGSGHHIGEEAEWMKVFDKNEAIYSIVQVALSRENIQIHTPHFCNWGILYRGPVDMVVLMLLNQASLNSLDVVYIKVLVILKESVKEACAAEKKNGWHVCSVDNMGVVFKVENNEKPLKVRIWDITPASHWHYTELTDDIPYEYLQKGRAKIEFSFRKKRRSVLRIKGLFNINQEDNRYQVTNSHFDSGIIGMNQDKPPTPGYPNPPSNGSMGYISASPGMSSNPGSVSYIQPPSVESLPMFPVPSPSGWGIFGSSPGPSSLLSIQSPQSIEQGHIESQDKDQTDNVSGDHQDSEVVTDINLRALASQIGTEWEPLATHLGLTAAEIQQLRMDGTNRGIVNVIFDMLISWKNRQPQRTNLRTVLRAALQKVGLQQVADSFCPPCQQRDINSPPTKNFKKSTEESAEACVASCSHQEESTEIDDVQFVSPDEKGYYVDHHMEEAWPSKKQMKSQTYYRMWTTKKKGRALVINISDFKDLPRREGSEINAINIAHFLRELGYDIDERDDLTAQEIKRAVVNFASTCNQDSACCSSIVVLMSYGNAEFVYGSDTKRASLSKLLKAMNGTNCPGLKTKPKLFFYDASHIPSTSEHILEEDDPDSMSRLLAEVKESDDMFIGYAITHGQMSLRKDQPGTPFIQALCEVGLKYAHEDDLDELVKKINQHMTNMRAIHCADEEVVQMTQRVPEWVSHKFSKTFSFLPGFPPSDWPH